MDHRSGIKALKEMFRPPGRPNSTEQALQRIEQTLQQQNLKINVLIRMGVKLMSDLSDAIDAAEAAATADADANNAAAALLVSLSDMLKDALANGTPEEQVARVRSFTDALNQRSADLAAAVVANTPAA
jgi:hypothetical protein